MSKITLSFYKVHTEPILQTIVNTISLGCAVNTLFLVYGLSKINKSHIMLTIFGYFRPHIFNIVSLRFQGIIALVDIIRHLTYSSLIHPGGSICAYMGFLAVFINNFYLLINVIIAIKFQVLYFHNIPPQKEIEVLLLVGATMVAIVIDVIPFAFDFYEKNEFGVCVVNAGAEKKEFFKTILFYFVPSTALLYCLIVFIAVFMFLKLRKNYLEMKIPNKTIFLFGEIIKAREFIEKLYFRMALYPISAFICFFPYIFGNIYFDIHNDSPD